MEFSQHTLEYDLFINLLSGYTKNNSVKRTIKQLKPKTKLDEINRDHKLIQVMMQLKTLNLDLPQVEYDDLYKIFKRATVVDSWLGVSDLLKVKKFLDSVRFISQSILNIERGSFQLQNRSLSNIREDLLACRDVYDCISGALEAPDFIKNSASSELERVRQEIFNAENSLRHQIDLVLTKLTKDDMLQDSFFTIRNNRFVVPVKAELKRRVPGVIQDYSDTERTVFIEPAHLVELGNKLASLKAEEKYESRRILKFLTTKVRSNLEELTLTQQTLNYYEYIRTVSTWGWDYNCSIPQFSSFVKIKKARHPLLEKQFRQENQAKKLVPLDFEINPRKVKTVAITGSNAGGKTVVLKTVGLIALIAQTGLPVPCEKGSHFMIYHNILADIGDQQSIQYNLSTFSSHLSKVNEFLKLLDRFKKKENLVLFDEIGSGTDPLEGGALASAILKNFCEKASLTIASTHLGSVKTFVEKEEKMINAAMLFNTKTFTPEFQLHIGRPGASHALNLAKKMAIPAEILDDAKSYLDTDQLRLESMLLTLEEDQREFYHESSRLKEELMVASQTKTELTTEMTAIKRDRKQIMNEAYKEAAMMLKNTQRDMKKIISQMKTDADYAAAQDKLKVKEEKVVESIKRTEAKPMKPLKPKQISVGQKVWVEKLQAKATIIAYTPGDSKVKVDLNGLPFEVPVKQLGKTSQETEEKPKPVSIKTSRPIARDVKSSVDVQGLRVHQALNKIDHFLDQAMLANMPEVKIVHGLGAGILRDAVHDYLRRLNYTFRSGDHEKKEGGDGVTIVEF